MSKALAGISQYKIAFAQLGEPQQLECLTKMKYLVGFELQVASQNGQVGVSVIRGPRKGLDQARKHVRRDVLQDHPDARAGDALDRGDFGLRTLCHAGIDAVDELAEC